MPARPSASTILAPFLREGIVQADGERALFGVAEGYVDSGG
jgi:hypothetical protein